MEKKETKNLPLDFKPVTEGLGFHPFSDGMPYAPLQKNRNRPAVNSTAPTGVHPGEPPLEMGTGAEVAGPVTMAETLPKMTQAPWTPGNLYLFQRAMAYLLDQLVLGILFLGMISAMISNHLIGADVLLHPEALIFAAAVFFTMGWLIIVSQEVILGSTLGKRIFRLGFEPKPFRIFLRALLFIPCSLFLGIGLFWGVFNVTKTCLHDRLAGIQPIDI